MEKTVISQKEYLRKYLSSGSDEKKKKKKKKKPKIGSQTVKIIDDDIDLKNMRPIEDNEFDLFLDTEDAPQIAGIVDEGPDFSNKSRWKIMANIDDGDITITSHDTGRKHENDINDIETSNSPQSSPPRRTKYSDDDLSPPRKSKSIKERGERSQKSKKDVDSDFSPPRKLKSGKSSDSKHKRKYSESSSDTSRDSEIDTKSRKRKKKTRPKEKKSDLDLSPPRKSRNQDSDLSPPRQDENNDSDLSPPRRNKKYHGEILVEHKEASKKNKRIASDSDFSPPRRNNANDSDLSPPRRNTHKKPQKNAKYNDAIAGPSKVSKDRSDSDLSPPRRSRNDDSDLSPPRRNVRHESRANTMYKNPDPSSNSNKSPPRNRRKHYDADLSPPRRSKKHSMQWEENNDSNSSQSKQNKTHKYSSTSLHRDDRSYKHSDKKRSGERSADLSPSRKRNRASDRNSSPPSKPRDHNDEIYERYKRDKVNNRYESDPEHRSNSHSSSRRDKTSRWDRENTTLRSKQQNIPDEDSDKRMKKTLDGKTAGLQDAKALREETEAHKKREAEHFSKLSKEISGVGQAAVVRDTKTGRKRNLEAEAAEEREKQKRQAELNEKYNKWGKGLKQVEDRQEKLQDDLYEMSKPLARYADDADLDRTLRDQDREGDPMLEYIKQKQIKEGKRKPDRPTYEGSFMPNRFAIKPGHRWDGVDRSNGYEKRWFEAQNAKVARQEEAYKWSTSDM